jgi:hypothetical protein
MYDAHTNDPPEAVILKQQLHEASNIDDAVAICEAYGLQQRAEALSVVVPRILDWVLGGNAKANPLARPLALAWALGHGAMTQHGGMAESAEAVGMSRAGMQQLCARAKAHLGL